MRSTRCRRPRTHRAGQRRRVEDDVRARAVHLRAARLTVTKVGRRSVDASVRYETSTSASGSTARAPASNPPGTARRGRRRRRRRPRRSRPCSSTAAAPGKEGLFLVANLASRRWGARRGSRWPGTGVGTVPGHHLDLGIARGEPDDDEVDPLGEPVEPALERLRTFDHLWASRPSLATASSKPAPMLSYMPPSPGPGRRA